MNWIWDDGGRAEAGFKGTAPGDCVTRAIAIAFRLPYRDVYDVVNLAAKAERQTKAASRSNARTGVRKKTSKALIAELGGVWTPTMRIGSGTQVHLRREELPEKGRLIVKVTRHLVAVVDGTIHDIFDPSRDGTRCVYGYWTISS